MIDSFTVHVHSVDTYEMRNWREIIKQLFCHHDKLLHFEKDRVCLKCVSCGHESPGWDIEVKK